MFRWLLFTALLCGGDAVPASGACQRPVMFRRFAKSGGDRSPPSEHGMNSWSLSLTRRSAVR